MTPPRYLVPKLYTVLREGIPRAQLGRDLAAGVTVGIVAFPLAIAFAIASGVEPVRGLTTAIIAGFLISALSGSRVQIGGPTGAFVVIVYEIVQTHGYEGLAIATLLAGALLVVMGIARLGSVIRFIPYPVTVGFTTGIALIIFVSQVRDVLGLDVSEMPADFFEKLAVYGDALATVNTGAVAIAVTTVAIVVMWQRVTHRVPGSLVAIVVTTLVAHLFSVPVETIGTRFGEMPASIPSPHLPDFEGVSLRSLLSPALSIALLGAIESLLSALVADGMTGRNHRPNAELVAQGVANLASPLFGGIPATGAIARTATNVRSGGRTPIAGIVHSAVLLALLLGFGRLAALVPMASLAGVLCVIAYQMSEVRIFARLLRSPRGDVVVLLSTFALTVVFDLVVAIQIGVVLSALLFMRRMADVTEVGSLRELEAGDEGDDDPNRLPRRSIPDDVEVFEVNGAFFFGAADKFRSAIQRIARPQRVVILHLQRVPFLDATALQVIESALANFAHDGTALILAGLRPKPLAELRRSGLVTRIGEENICPNIGTALDRAREVATARSESGIGVDGVDR